MGDWGDLEEKKMMTKGDKETQEVLDQLSLLAPGDQDKPEAGRACICPTQGAA